MYPITEELNNESCKHCAALFLVKPKVGFQPKPEYRNGTITFIEYQGITYGITCKHVVEALRNKIQELGDENLCFATIVKRNIYIIDRFKFPEALDPFTQEDPDIAIQQIHPKLCETIGKKPFKLTSKNENYKNIKHALAVGFPEEKVEKKEHENLLSYQIQMACIHALGELQSHNDTKLLISSNLDTDPDAYNLSGMSGGPIFWSTDLSHGLLGITYEALPTKPDQNASNKSFGGGPRVVVKGETLTEQKFSNWVSKLEIDTDLFPEKKTLTTTVSVHLE
ncbi:MAG: hypothetical protein ACUZ8O_05815 [Candidatus Anammoxibacter sp.]